MKHRSRLTPSQFDFPLEKYKSGYYADSYFNRTKLILEETAQKKYINKSSQT